MVETSFKDIELIEHDVVEPVTLAEAKLQCRVDFTDDDAFITALIPACRQAIESYCHISIVSKTVTTTIGVTNRPYGPWIRPNGRPVYDEFELPYGPVKSLTSVSYEDTGGSYKVLVANSDYLLRGKSYKSIQINNSYDNNVLIYETGYPVANSVSVIPWDIKLAILNELAYRYELRGEPNENIRATAFTEEGVCQAARVLVDKYIRMAWQ